MYYKPLPDNLTIKKSDIDGLGLFAVEEIRSGVIGIGWVKQDIFPDGYIRTPLGGFINHSDTPNCGRSQIRIRPGFDRWNIVVIEDIDEGEELTLKYKLYDPEKI